MRPPERYLALGIAVLLFLSVSVGSAPLVSAYEVHAPIEIDGNGAFTPANGVITGTGTSENPYIIEGWEISASGSIGIKIARTDKFFIIRNCRIYDGEYYGIQLWEVKNGKVVTNLIGDTDTGISLGHSSSCTLDSNDIENSTYYGIFLTSCTDCVIHNNKCENGQNGIGTAGGVDSKGNIFNFNYLLNSTEKQAYDSGTNKWDHEGLGNYWSEWQTPDTDNDGIVDVVREIEGDTNVDEYPLILGYGHIPVTPVTFPEPTDPGEAPDIPEADPTALLPLMLSFGIIIGMALVGLNLSRSSHNPMPMLFLAFAGIMLAWMMGWLDLWIFVTAIAFVAMLSAILWRKIFSKG